MDESSNVILPRVPKPQNNVFKKLSLIEIGFFEIGFVLLLLLVVFGTLNFFNVININKVLPVFSFLPKYSPNSAVRVDRLLTANEKNAYISSNINRFLKAQFVPSCNKNVPVTKDNPQFGTFSFTWTCNTTQFTSTLYFDKGLNTVNSTNISFSIPITQKVVGVISANTALSLSEIYFIEKTFSNQWQCNSITRTISFCSFFTQDTLGEHGYAVIESDENNKDTLFSCFVPKGSGIYATKISSCLDPDAIARLSSHNGQVRIKNKGQ